MTARKVKEVKSQEKLTLDNLESGMKLSDSTRNPKEWQVDDDLIEQMRRYEQESNKSAIWKGKITGMFLFFKYYEDHPEEKTKTKKKPGRKPKAKEDVEIEELDELEEIEQAIEEQANEENLLKDAMEDYKSEYGVKNVNTKSQKFKQFFYKWKQSD